MWTTHIEMVSKFAEESTSIIIYIKVKIIHAFLSQESCSSYFMGSSTDVMVVLMFQWLFNMIIAWKPQ